ncbi:MULTISPECIES: DUF3560 domain-containing protein [unclassified Streptomyces]|uniref:DUF3560 domain-containing protein n=1 Tax=unclassified Streptomyces TaxID=2593676 RepID=UPI002DDB0D13|nr:DUF3560 domain-containing protein [Streptomyces sp. NBC_01795]WSA97778.1 DUF3560 domain-containing protein [Streptomyces sp. NBC_01795]WSS46705.1 DUF3560 domain-containing protein [Streptomyces sp. NBC_01187]WSS47078.1 DUF3560 domain-containing protein [Streptomyces sp. NBC_01187]
MPIKITHTQRDGTLVRGTKRKDGSAEILKQRRYGHAGRDGFRFSRTLGCWYLPRSRDTRAATNSINRLAALLRDAGFTVDEPEIDDTVRRTFAEAEADRAERATERSERFEGYADSAASRSSQSYEKAHSLADAIPTGQPVHGSRDRNRRERIHTSMAASISENDRTSHWAGRAEAAANWETFRKNPSRTLRRIAKLEADERRMLRAHYRPEELENDLADIREQLAYWRDVVAEAERNGFKVWSRSDFTKGDFAKIRGRWFQVQRVNAKSLTVPAVLNMSDLTVITGENNRYSWTDTVTYDEVTARLSAEEMSKRQDAVPGEADSPGTPA